ncbi:MAG: right-handed parallel beta-helix repeat-containing protein [Candidatus Nanopelagicales bacterium]
MSVNYLPQPSVLGEGLSLADLPLAVTESGALTADARVAGWACVGPEGGYWPPQPSPTDEVGCPDARPTRLQGYFPDQAWSGDRPLRQVLDEDLVGPGRFYVPRSSATDSDPKPTRMVVAASDAKDLRVSDSTGDFLVIAADDVSIEGITVARHSPDWRTFATRIAAGLSGATLREVTVRDTASTPLKLAGTWREADGLVSATVIDGVAVERSGWLAAVILYADDTAVTRSRFVGSDPWREFAGGPQLGGIKVTKSHRLAISGSDLKDNGGHGIWVDQSSYDVTIADSVISGNTGSGVFFEISHGLTLANNLILADGAGAGVRLAGASGVQLVNNTVVGGATNVAVLTDFRSQPFSPGRPCAEHPARYGQEAELHSCGIAYVSDFDRARSGEFGPGPNLTPGLNWYPHIELMINNVLADSSGGRFCPSPTALCVRGSTARGDQVTTVALKTVFTPDTVLDGNVYQGSGAVAALLPGRDEPGEFEAARLPRLRGPDGLGSAHYDLIVERHGLAGAGFVDSSGAPTNALIARQGQARAVPQDERLNAFVPAASRRYGASAEVLNRSD